MKQRKFYILNASVLDNKSVHQSATSAYEFIHNNAATCSDYCVVEFHERPPVLASPEFVLDGEDCSAQDVFTDPDLAFEDLLSDIERAKEAIRQSSMRNMQAMASSFPELHQSALSLLDFKLSEPTDLDFPALSIEELFAWWNSSPESMSPENNWRVQCWRAETGKMCAGEYADWLHAKFIEDNLDKN